MNEIKNQIERTYYIVYNNEEEYHYGFIDENQVLSSGMINLWYSTDREEWVDKLIDDFKIIPKNDEDMYNVYDPNQSLDDE